MMQIKLVEKKTRVIHLSKRSIPLTGPLSKKSFHLGPVCNILVMQHSLVVYCGISHESLVFSPYKHEPSGTILPYHKSTGADTINATYARRPMGRLCVIPPNFEVFSCILIGCIFSGILIIKDNYVASGNYNFAWIERSRTFSKPYIF